MARSGPYLWVFLFLLAACTSADPPAGDANPSPPASNRFERAPTAYASFVLYHRERPADAALASLQQVAASTDGGMRVVEEMPEQVAELTATIWQIENLAQDYPPPDAEYLQRFGKGISKAQADGLAASRSGWRLVYAYPARQAAVALRAVDRSVLQLARRSEALIWDSETRVLYAPDHFQESRVDSSSASDSVIKHTTINVYQEGDYVRAVSLGMAQFGLPDLVIEQLSWATYRSLVSLMIGIAQQMVEGAEPDASGTFAFDASAIRNSAVRDEVVADSIGDASHKGTFTLRAAVPDEGDADNPLLAIEFDAYAGNDEFARQDTAVATIFGWRDEIKRIKHNDELKAASHAARALLPQLRRDFEAGFEPGEYIQVKAPFPTASGGQEWMWVEVTAWQDDAIHGLLRNEPFDIPELHAGQKVEVDPDEVFDYLRQFADGREEGNTTAEIIARMQGETEAAGTE
ncbi:MAG TPA: DUF2314 domain-containing protein [Xanthomonadales bacterium]|nr:DUF2314 domain-containing protein [Xanthomonadales bacterium]